MFCKTRPDEGLAASRKCLLGEPASSTSRLCGEKWDVRLLEWDMLWVTALLNKSESKCCLFASQLICIDTDIIAQIASKREQASDEREWILWWWGQIAEWLAWLDGSDLLVAVNMHWQITFNRDMRDRINQNNFTFFCIKHSIWLRSYCHLLHQLFLALLLPHLRASWLLECNYFYDHIIIYKKSFFVIRTIQARPRRHSFVKVRVFCIHLLPDYFFSLSEYVHMIIK